MERGWTPEFGSRLGALIALLDGPREAAKIAGVTPEAVSKWRNGKAKMPFQSAAAFCAATGESLDWLATGQRVTASSRDPRVEPEDDKNEGKRRRLVIEVPAGMSIRFEVQG
tara:strand:- start:198 stop:533 length:336 start_codon:yes stop_codon:yes gene_type:complete